jgi:hypothetical protein
MEVSDRNRHGDPGSAGRRSLGGHGRSAGPDGRGGTVSAGAVAEVLAILVIDLVGVLPVDDLAATLERLANRLDEQSRTPGGRETAALLGGVAEALMRL